MEINTKECGRQDRNMERGFTYGKMEIITKVVSGLIKDKEKVSFITQAREDTKVIGKMIKDRERGFYLIIREQQRYVTEIFDIIYGIDLSIRY